MMTQSATGLWYIAEGYRLPRIEGIQETPGAVCAVCGSAAPRGMDRAKVLSDSFTGYNTLRYPGSQVVCEPCVYAMRKHKIDGKLYTLRNYSHYVRMSPDGDPEYRQFTKHDLIWASEVLIHPPAGTWAMALSETGKKHLLPYTPVNMDGTRYPRIYIEDRVVQYDPAELAYYLDLACRLYQAGANKGEIRTGDYSALKIAKIGIDTWEPLERAFAPVRRKQQILRLVMWLTHKRGGEYDETRAHEQGKEPGNRRGAGGTLFD